MFAQTAKNIATMKLTENGAVAYNTTENAILDLFAQTNFNVILQRKGVINENSKQFR